MTSPSTGFGHRIPSIYRNLEEMAAEADTGRQSEPRGPISAPG